MWWEQNNPIDPVGINREPTHCPVCKHQLDWRFPDESLWTYCKECKVKFFYSPNNRVPTIACPDSLQRGKKCNCSQCRDKGSCSTNKETL